MAITISDLNLADAVEYHYGAFPPQVLDYERLIDPLAKATEAIARFDQMMKNMHNSEILIAPLRNQEAVISSRMEGTISTMDEILQYEADHDEAENGEVNVNTRTEVIETYLYQQTLKLGQAYIENGRPLSESLIRNLHQRLLSYGRGAEKSPGQFKTEQNYLADKSRRNIRFIPVSPEKLLEGLEALFSYINHSDDQILIKSAISHVEFEALHPFKDGNGRIGRMIITLMLWRAGAISAPHFYISGYLEEKKDEYIDFMRGVSKDGNWTDWCAFFLVALEQQAIRNLKIAEDISDLYENMKQTFKDVLDSKWAINALDFVFTSPVFKSSQFTRKAGLPASSAAKHMKALVDAGVLVTVREAAGSRPALLRFEPLMQLVRV